MKKIMRNMSIIIMSLLFAMVAAQLDLTYKDNHYILLSSSKFFFNYRHSSNAMIFYQYLKRHGVPDDRVSALFITNLT